MLLRRSHTSGQALARLLDACLGVMDVNLPCVLADADVECLHDLRTASRRARTLYANLRDAVPARRREHYRREFRWLSAATGPCRDLDVLLALLPAWAADAGIDRHPGLAVLEDALTHARAQRQRTLHRTLTSDRLARFMDGLHCLVDDLADARDPAAAALVGPLADRLVARRFRRLRRHARRLDQRAPFDDFHALRKETKRLRYTLEGFAWLYDGPALRQVTRPLKRAQDELGTLCDHHVHAAWLSAVADRHRLTRAGAAAREAAGLLAAGLRHGERRQRQLVVRRMRAVTGQPMRRQVGALVEGGR